jgi:ABC-type Zn uptake system ZnuABC Zn-binding protein ZnuA
MRRRPTARLSVLLIVASALAAACAPAPAGTAGPTAGRLQVIATTTVFADLVSQVGGDRVAATSLVPKGGDVHTFDPTPADVRKVSTAALLVRNGLGLDDWLTKLVSDAGTSATLVTLGEGLEGVQYITAESGQTNPHLWMDVAYAEKYVDRIEAALATAMPADAAAFAANAEAYKTRLAALDDAIRARLSAIPAANRVVVSFHDAFPYFAAAYGLTVVGTIVAAPGQDPSAGQIADLVSKIKSSGAKAIFAEAQFNDALAKAIASETGATVVYNLYDGTLGDAPLDTYIGMMTWDADQVASALGG